METTYFTIDARRVLVWGGAEARQAAGGGGGVCYAVIPRGKRAPDGPQEGKILQFDAFRGGDAPRVSPEEPGPEARELPAAQRRPDRRESGKLGLPLAADLIATGAVVGAAITAAVGFLLL